MRRGQKTSAETRLKMSLAAKGKPKSEQHRLNNSRAKMGTSNTPETRIKISNTLRNYIATHPEAKITRSHRGENHPNWQGGKTALIQKLRNSTEYKLWREAVFKRDNYTCVWCGDSRGGNLNADHIKPFALFPELRFAIDNGRTLCEPCHWTTDTFGAKIKI